jgi:hypothetical protein
VYPPSKQFQHNGLPQNFRTGDARQTKAEQFAAPWVNRVDKAGNDKEHQGENEQNQGKHFVSTSWIE